MAKKSYQLVQLWNSEENTSTKYTIKKTIRGEKASMKIELRKYDPVTKKHALFTTKKMPSHSKK